MNSTNNILNTPMSKTTVSEPAISKPSISDNDISIIDTLPGSLPMGGTVANTPIYRTHNIDEKLLQKNNPHLNTQRLPDIDLGGKLAFVMKEVLSKNECQKMIHVVEKMGFRPEAPGIQTPPGMRMNQSVHWLCHAELLTTLFDRIGELLPQTLEGRPLYSRLSQRINFYKYQNNDVFNKHVDGSWPGYGFDASETQMVQWPNVGSMLTMLLYLNDHNDDFVGGETQIYGVNNRVDVLPVTGNALFFKHGFSQGSVAHIGKTVKGNGNKYVARINILYSLNK